MADAARMEVHAARSSGFAHLPFLVTPPVRSCGDPLGLAVIAACAAGTQLKLISLLRREVGGLMSPTLL